MNALVWVAVGVLGGLGRCSDSWSMALLHLDSDQTSRSAR